MRELGVDPGLTGGLALLTDEDCEYPRILELAVLPVVTVAVTRRRGGKTVVGSKGMIDRQALRTLLAAWAPGHVTIEAPGMRPNQSTQSSMTCGILWGILWMAIAHLPHVQVHPATWTRAMLEGTPAMADPKDRAREACRRLWPGQNFLATGRSRVAHAGLCDAALLAAYGLRRG